MKSIRNTAVAVFALLAVAGTANAGPIFNGSEYEVILAEGVTWNQARTAAQGLGAGWDLASIGSAAENGFVAGLLNTSLPQRSHFWIGATDAVSEGTWAWVDSTPFVYTNWWGGEPNDSGGEDYLAYDLRSGNWAWNDGSDGSVVGGGFSRGYVAEQAVNAVPEPATISLLGLGALGRALARRRRAR